jgi:hypothetical protein
MKYRNYVTRFSFPYFDMPVVANGFESRERPDDKLPYDQKQLRTEERSALEPAEVPEISARTPSDRTSAAEQIEPKTVTPTANAAQNLILRG